VGRAKADAENRATETARAMLRMEGIMDVGMGYQDVDGLRVRVRVGKEKNKRERRGTRNKGATKETFLPTYKKSKRVFLGPASEPSHQSFN